MVQYSRKRFQEALFACKQICRNDRLPALTRLRSAELIFLLYGGELPAGLNKRDKRSIKDLVQERSLEKQIRTAVDEQTTPKTAEQAQEDKLSMALAEFLKTTPKATPTHSADTSEAASPVQTPTQKEGHGKEPWLHQLAIAGDLSANREDRVTAIRWIQSKLAAGHPLRSRDAYDLLREVLDPWDTRLFPDRSGIGYFKSRVLRPAQDISDLWK